MERYVDATANEDFWSSHNESDVTKKMMQWPGLIVNAKPGTCGRGKNNTIVFFRYSYRDFDSRSLGKDSDIAL